MGIRVSWVDDSKTVILREFDVTWTWDDFYSSQRQVGQMLASVSHLVHQIFDFSASKSLPPNTLTHLRNSARNMPSNRGRSIVITQSNFYRNMYRVLDRMFPAITQRVVIVGTREEALAKVTPARTGD